MWYFAWILGLGPACALAVLDGIGYEVRVPACPRAIAVPAGL